MQTYNHSQLLLYHKLWWFYLNAFRNVATPSLRHVNQSLWLLPLPCFSESSNLLPPLVIYMHCSAIIQVIKTPADRSLFTLWVWFISVSVYVKQPDPLFYMCVCCVQVCVFLYLTVCPQVCCRFRFKCSFFLSLYLPHATLCYRLAF